MAALLSSCFTGIESTPRISQGDVKRRDAAQLTPEQQFLADIMPLPPSQWQTGKRFFVTDDKISIIFMPSDTGCDSLSGSDLVFESFTDVPSVTGNGATMLTFTSPAMTLSGENPYFFRTVANDTASAIVGAGYVINNLKAKKVAILHDNSEYGKGYAEQAADYLKKNSDIEIVLFEAITPGAADYSSVIRKVRRVDADVLMWGGYYPEASKLLSNMNSLDAVIPMIGPDGLKDLGFVELAGADAENVYASGPTDTSSNPVSKYYAEKHMAKYGSTPGAFFDNAVSAALALMNAIEKAGTTDSAKVIDALHKEEIETAVGSIHFDEHGDAVGVGMSIYQIQNGQYVEMK